MKTIDVNARLATMNVTSARGASMGRRDVVNNPEAEVVVQRVMYQDGDYDLGGAYWGALGDRHLYCAMDETGDVCVFVRADNLEQAKFLTLEHYPDLVIRSGIDPVEALNGYLEAVLFAECDMDKSDEDDSSLMQQNYDISDFSAEALAKSRGDVNDFLTAAEVRGIDLLPWGSHEAGACFYFDRNGHGCGFRDKGNHESAYRASRLAQQWGSIHCWVSEPAEGKAYGEINVE